MNQKQLRELHLPLIDNLKFYKILPIQILSDQAPVPKAIETKTSAFAASAPEFVSTEAAAAESGKTKGFRNKVQSIAPKNFSEMARVKFVYVPQHGDELALGEIDVLINITNKVSLFPSLYPNKSYIFRTVETPDGSKASCMARKDSSLTTLSNWSKFR